MSEKDISIKDFFYDLPDHKIAKHPIEHRDECKLLVKEGKTLKHCIFNELPRILDPDTVLIYNNSKVIHARLKFRKGEDNEGALIEVFCLEPVIPNDYHLNFSSRRKCIWRCIVGNSKKWKADTLLHRTVEIGDRIVQLNATRQYFDGNLWNVEFSWDNDDVTFSEIIEAAGEIPIPPYLNRASEKSDETDYQTIYSLREGSVAAPTAGLHFTHRTLDEIDCKGIKRRELTLHVGAGTFKPVTTENIGGHYMHKEFFSVPCNVVADILRWKCGEDTVKNVTAVGTTTVRTLESLYYIGCLLEENKWTGIVPQWYPYQTRTSEISLERSLNNILNYYKEGNVVGETEIIIVPGFRFRIVDSLITNFHQPGSTLLLLVSAFLMNKGDTAEEWKDMYENALENGYRFLSYGDACLLK